MSLSDAAVAHLEMYQERVNAQIEKARAARQSGKSRVADRLLEGCVDIYREYALSFADIRFKVSYLCGTAVRFAVGMGMHSKAHEVMSEAERMCPPNDAELVEGVKKMRAVVNEYRAQNYHPSQKQGKKRRLH